MDIPDIGTFLNQFGWVGQGVAWILDLLMQNIIITIIGLAFLVVVLLNWKHIWGYTNRELVG